MAKALDGKVAIITGSSRGIGKATAVALAKQGGKVVVNYANSSGAADAVVAEIEGMGGDAWSKPPWKSSGALTYW